MGKPFATRARSQDDVLCSAAHSLKLLLLRLLLLLLLLLLLPLFFLFLFLCLRFFFFHTYIFGNTIERAATTTEDLEAKGSS